MTKNKTYRMLVIVIAVLGFVSMIVLPESRRPVLVVLALLALSMWAVR
jgi:hypothetical protein